MRLDKYLAEAAQCTRSESRQMIRAGRVSVNGDINEDFSHDEMPIYGKAMPEVVVEATSTDEWKEICNSYCFQDPYVLNLEETVAKMEEQNTLFEGFMPYL